MPLPLQSSSDSRSMDNLTQVCPCTRSGQDGAAHRRATQALMAGAFGEGAFMGEG